MNYNKVQEINNTIILHPENLPSSKIAQYTSFGFKNIKADMYWLKIVQYIGNNPFKSEYKKYLYQMLNIITDLNPEFTQPYIIGEILLPSHSYHDEKNIFSKNEQNNFIQQAVNIGKKGIKNLCNSSKLKLIKKEDNLDKLQENQYVNTCTDARVPYNLAYIYFQYLNKAEEASYYYKVSSTNPNSFLSSKGMAAIMQGKKGNREKAFFMFINMAINTDKKQSKCKILAQILYKNTLSRKFLLNKDYIIQVQKIYNQTFNQKEKQQKSIAQSISCINYLQKAIRQQNLMYIQRGNKNFASKKGVNAKNAKVLFENGYIDIIPTDPKSQGKENDFIYIYNKKIKQFDYSIGKY